MNWMLAVGLMGLALTDAAFAGYRDAAGRDGAIFKAELYRAAVRRGLRFGLLAVAVSCAWVVVVVLASGRPAVVLEASFLAARPVLLVLGGYAVAVLAALGVWTVGESDLRSLASVMVLGPFTLLRPWLIVGAAVAGGVGQEPFVVAVIAGPCLVQMLLPWLLGRGWRGGRSPLPALR